MRPLKHCRLRKKNSPRSKQEKLTGALAAADKEAGNAQSLLQDARIVSVDLAKAYEALLPVTQAVRAHDTAIAEHTKRISEKVAEKTREEALLKQSRAKTQAATSEIQTLSEEAVKLEADTAPDSRAARLFAKSPTVRQCCELLKHWDAAAINLDEYFCM